MLDHTPPRAKFSDVTLDDKYTKEEGRVFISGIQAIVRLPLMQRQRDLKAGLNTAGFISGYRGSPLGGVDQALWKAEEHLKKHHVHFEPGINEDLAATAVWGSQQAELFKGFRYDGVFGMWYGKGPGVDRSSDAIKHANLAGTSKHGGVLLVGGDDHGCKSSTLAHQSEYAYMDFMVPVLAPSSIQEILDYGLYGWAMSRYSGLWAAMKVVSDTADSSASVMVGPDRVKIALPADFAMPKGGLNQRGSNWPPVGFEELLHYHKLPAAIAFARANNLDQIIWNPSKARIGIVTAGKAYMDVRQALSDLGIDEKKANEIGLRLYKVAMPWPLEPQGLQRFAEGLEEILVVEEKRDLMEAQIKTLLYPSASRPRIVGKTDENGQKLLQAIDELSPALVARAIAARLSRFYSAPDFLSARDAIEKRVTHQHQITESFKRIPYFCSGCPHNSSTKLPDGSVALAGIGCHLMAVWMDRETYTVTQMGGEGVTWVGQAPFTDEKHVFVNLGDGTYYHSGLLAIRAAIAAKVNATYKILYNDAVAMTGGQPVEGGLTVEQIAQQLHAEGVQKVVVVADDPNKYPIGTNFGHGVSLRPREDLDAVQRELRDHPGVTAIIYDQTCAAEKRRRRKRGTFYDPPRRIFINDQVCEGCGDCSVKSNCLSVVPVETEYGRKRAIDQSSCNKDYSCVNGFCPSFVSVLGGEVRKSKAVNGGEYPSLPEPQLPRLDRPQSLLVNGIGGTGIVTVGALLGMAAHLEGKGATVMDMTGLAQKGGAVWSHVRFAQNPEDLYAVRIGAGSADYVLGADMVVTASEDTIQKIAPNHTKILMNDQETMIGNFTRNPDLHFPANELKSTVRTASGAENLITVDASRVATALLGDSIATNLFMLGYMYQKGWIPVSSAAIERAIELNEVSVRMNKQSFYWGRKAAIDWQSVDNMVKPKSVPDSHRKSETLDELIARRVKSLTAYQDADYAAQYKELVDKVRAVESARVGSDKLTQAVARYYYKLMAYKDEYEVARLYTSGEFEQKLRQQFSGDYKLQFHLAPPLLAPRDVRTGELKKMTFGPRVFTAFKILAKLRFLRGTPFDIFGYTAERKMERALIKNYAETITALLDKLSPKNHVAALELAMLPEHIRGYGHVKERHLHEAAAREKQLRQKAGLPV